MKLKAVCVSSYRAFEAAAELLDQSRKRTAAAEKAVAEADKKKAETGSLSSDEELNIVEMGRRAAESLKSMTEKLNEA